MNDGILSSTMVLSPRQGVAALVLALMAACGLVSPARGTTPVHRAADAHGETIHDTFDGSVYGLSSIHRISTSTEERQLCVFELVFDDECKSKRCFGTLCSHGIAARTSARRSAPTIQCYPSQQLAANLNSIQCDRISIGDYVLHVSCRCRMDGDGGDNSTPTPQRDCHPGTYSLR